MRMLLPGLMLLVGCAAGTPPAAQADHAAAIAACAAAVAAHVGKVADDVSAEWTGATATGGGLVTVIDGDAGAGERTHVCDVDASGQVRAIRHVGP